jgi:hypothetical protein
MVQISQCLDSYFTTYYRVLGRLVALAESVETALGLQPWSDPAGEDADRRNDWTETSVFGELSPELPEWWWVQDEIVG